MLIVIRKHRASGHQSQMKIEYIENIEYLDTYAQCPYRLNIYGNMISAKISLSTQVRPGGALTLSIRGLGPIPLSIPNNFDIIHSLKK